VASCGRLLAGWLLCSASRLAGNSTSRVVRTLDEKVKRKVEAAEQGGDRPHGVGSCYVGELRKVKLCYSVACSGTCW
jgi:hypothetical protein